MAITVTDEEEPPLVPGTPSVSPVSSSSTSLSVTWSEPSNRGRPAIESYDLQYREVGSETWEDGPRDRTSTTATITGLGEDTVYQVQVRATNDEGDSGWSSPGTGRTNEPPNAAPRFASATAMRSLAENTATGTDIGSPLTATDSDNDTLTYSVEGPDAASFAIVSSSGQIRTRSSADYDYEAKSRYSVTVKADDGQGGSDTVAVTIDITDEDEPPLAPGAPSVSAVSGSRTALSVTWSAPSNSGRPAIKSYDLRYREVGTETWKKRPGRTVPVCQPRLRVWRRTLPIRCRSRRTTTRAPAAGRTPAPGGPTPTGHRNSLLRRRRAAWRRTPMPVSTSALPLPPPMQRDDTLTYSLEGTNAASFAIVSNHRPTPH